jgi:hypothetical protein
MRSRGCVARQGGGVTIIERGAAEAAQQIADALESAGLPYAIGGALALAIAGVPRGTADVDVNAFVDEHDVPRLIAVLQRLGIELDLDAAVARGKRDGMFVGRWDGMRIDVFLPSIPFAHEAARTRIRVTDADGWSGWFLSAEALAVFKLLFFRGKDMVDLERLVAVAGTRLDHGYVRRWMVDMMGEDDERVLRWDAIVAAFGPALGRTEA